MRSPLLAMTRWHGTTIDSHLNKLRLKDVVRDSDDEEGYDEEAVRRRVFRVTDTVRKLWSAFLGQQAAQAPQGGSLQPS